MEDQSENPLTARFIQDLSYVTDGHDGALLVDADLASAESIHLIGGETLLHVSEFIGEHGKFSVKAKREKRKQSFISRLMTALLGGLALVVPMLIMRLHPDLMTQLLTSSLFVLFVGTVLAWRMDDNTEMDIITATAAYAAVLVVFVGTSNDK